MDIQRFHSGEWSQVVAFGDLVFVAGQMAEETAGGPVADQAREVLARIDALLAEAGSDKTRILRATIWLTDMADYEAVSAVWRAWMPPEHAPARVCAEARLAEPERHVEIDAIAARQPAAEG